MAVLTSLPELIENYYGWLLVLSVAVFFVLEQWSSAFPWPATAGGGPLRRWTTGIVFGVLNRAFTSSILALPVLVWCTNFRWWSWPSWVPLWFLIVLTFLVRDLASYWFHRLGHAHEFFWRFHQIHHLDEAIDVSTELRVHFVERLFQTIITVVLIMTLSLPAYGVVLHGIVGFVTSCFHHANLKLPPWLERLFSPVIVTPAFHLPHHHELRRDTNSNYGFIFPWWDRLFGTYNTRRCTPDWQMGLDYSPDLNCIALLCEPFRPTPLWERRRASGRSPQPVHAEQEACQPANTDP
jgi:sterol desaturase/sphingolipid hydroxylase (fatty acid hydroxylase superfamily)